MPVGSSRAELAQWLSSVDVARCQDEPLAVLFHRVSSIHRDQDLLRSCSKAGSDLTVDAVLSVCRGFVHGVANAALFSANEEADDLATAHLRYLLAPFYLAEVLTGCPCQEGPKGRVQMVQEALSNYNAFLQRCSQYNLMGTVAQRMYEQEEESSGLDPASKRAMKVERFKADKALKARLSTLEQQQEQAKAQQEQDQESVELGGASGWDEEDERLLWLTTIQHAALTAIGQRGFLHDEQSLLQHAVQQEDQSSGRDQSAASEARQEMEAQQREEVLSALRKVAADLGTNTNKRKELQAQVFQPGYLMPTRTLAEQAEIEMADARRREQSERAAHEAEAKRKAELGSDEDEEELMKQRAWDDWKDSHPKGYGNSKIKPCG